MCSRGYDDEPSVESTFSHAAAPPKTSSICFFLYVVFVVMFCEFQEGV